MIPTDSKAGGTSQNLRHSALFLEASKLHVWTRQGEKGYELLETAVVWNSLHAAFLSDI